jgi:hypothetical protein
MITVEKKDGHKLKLSHLLQQTTNRHLDIYLFIPGELRVSSTTLSESEVYHTAITGKRTYYSTEYHLPLVHSRLASRGRLSSDQYRLSLSLYAYQYAHGLENTVQRLLNDTPELTASDIQETVQLSLRILRRLRRNIPTDKTLLKYYQNIDNYLSWFTEQQFLMLVAHLPRNNEYPEIKESLMSITREEDAHRKKQEYNTHIANQDITRMSNKMRLLRRLIEYPVTMQAKTTELGNGTRKAVTGFAAGFIMIFVTLMLIELRGILNELTIAFILLLSLIYAAREIFKDDLKLILWKWLRKGKPKWRTQYFDPHSRQMVGKQLEWLEYITYGTLPNDIKKCRRHKVSHREEKILHYKSTTQMATTKFLSGYDQTRETILINFGSFSRLMEKGSQKIYAEKDGQVIKESIEKRHVFNLITKETDEDGTMRLQRWKIVANRSKLISIEQQESLN